MKLTIRTDYSLRVLIFLGASHEKKHTIGEISALYGISKHHLVKVVHQLGQLGYVETVRGQGGGLRLAVKPEEINIGKVVKELELNFDMVQCFEKDNNGCLITSACLLKGALNKALNSFFKILEQYTLKDVLKNQNQLNEIFDLTQNK